MVNILICDDEASILKTLALLLKKSGYNTFQASDINQSCDILSKHVIDIAFVDIRLGSENGIELLKIIKREHHDTSVIIMSAYSSMDDTISALDLGAEAYIAKPVRLEEAVFHIRKILEKREIIEENRELKKLQLLTCKDVDIVGVSEKMKKVIDRVHQVKDLPSPVLIEGESGTGKEVVARAVHFLGVRRDKPFIGVNCSAIPASLFESELFGYKKGAFTGAVSDFEGLFSQAADGTFYLDDVDDIPMEFQPKLLRVLQENSFRRIGDPREYRLECRIIASTKSGLKKRAEESVFREDLFYRLNIINIYLPPLRERREDIIPLAEYFLSKKQDYLGIRNRYLERGAKDFLIGLDFKGNVRELENIIERALVFSRNKSISESDIKNLVTDDTACGSSSFEANNLRDQLKNREYEIIKETLKRFNGNRKLSADHLSISVRALLYKIKEYGL